MIGIWEYEHHFHVLSNNRYNKKAAKLATSMGNFAVIVQKVGATKP
ncbi:hypothetical protein J2W91_002913 [Paenibacillus amylolyticus]|uniref:Uncharacterized protein n=1 Tax=Paenibacillus amylolyticus TaxID=1451 RepID=A0AAP5LP93_PAEAM|nr:hypothetical protein [Paenibacillus amylolyticus]